MKRNPFVLPAVLFVFLWQGGRSASGAVPGGWPEPRHDGGLTAVQPLAGGMKSSPHVVAALEGRGTATASLMPVALPHGAGYVGLAIVRGALRCYSADGAMRWSLHPQGLNFSAISASGDLAGDGGALVALQAGRPTEPYGAAVLVSVADGKLLWRYDVEPMSYAWYLHVGNYLPGKRSKQIVVLMQGYPPDARNGYIALFDFADGSPAPFQRWRYDFDHYTCFPSFLTDDLDGDGIDELVVETHSRMWFLDALTGRVKQFLNWDVSPANIRSYGLVQFVDLNGDGRKDFLCIANFAQHQEVLLNVNGKMTKAWHHGWPESVTTSHVATCYPLPAHGDIDGDGKQCVVVSMFNSEGKAQWLTLVYDAVSGAVKYRLPGVIASTLVRVGHRDLILGEPSTDPGAAQPDGSHRIAPGAGLTAYAPVDGQLKAVWHDPAAEAVRGDGENRPCLKQNGASFTLAAGPQGALSLRPWTAPSSPVPAMQAKLPVGGVPAELLAADLLGEGKNQLIVYRDGVARVYRLEESQLKQVAEYPSSALPTIADLEGNGRLDLVLCQVSLEHQPVVKAVCPSEANRVLWTSQFPAPAHPSLPKPHPAYLRAGRFMGRKGADVYCWFAEPSVRSAMVDGSNGHIVWEDGEFASLQRYAGPSMNLASVAPLERGADHDDLVFTCPDYYCVADGRDGKMVLGPLFPPRIFNQPSQGLYTFPAILDSAKGEPTVCLVGGHYFQAAMSLHAKPLWYKLPVVGEARAANAGFLRRADGSWRMGFARQNGKFACTNVADGHLQWEIDIASTGTDAIACDVAGDGGADFVFATSHGGLYAVRDDGSVGRVLWTAELPGPAAGSPIAADLRGHGKSQIIVPLADGGVVVME
jgi:outer membrane protein assembly factor BamB